jgi:hypothetical protein
MYDILTCGPMFWKRGCLIGRVTIRSEGLFAAPEVREGVVRPGVVRPGVPWVGVPGPAASCRGY